MDRYTCADEQESVESLGSYAWLYVSYLKKCCANSFYI